MPTARVNIEILSRYNIMSAVQQIATEDVCLTIVFNE